MGRRAREGQIPREIRGLQPGEKTQSHIELSERSCIEFAVSCIHREVRIIHKSTLCLFTAGATRLKPHNLRLVSFHKSGGAGRDVGRIYTRAVSVCLSLIMAAVVVVIKITAGQIFVAQSFSFTCS